MRYAMNSASSAVEKGVIETTKEGDVNPRQAAVGACEVVELGLLADPENSQGQETHHVYQQPRRQGHQSVPQFVLTVNCFSRRSAKIEHQQRHGHGKNAVTQGRQAFHTLAGNPVVGSAHGQRV